MANTDIKLNKPDFVSDFIESRKEAFQKGKLLTLMIVAVFHLLLITIMIVSSIWEIYYIDEPSLINLKMEDKIPVWIAGPKIFGDSRINNSEIRKIVNIKPSNNISYAIEMKDSDYSPHIGIDSYEEPLLDLDFGDYGSYLLPEQLDNIKKEKDEVVKNEPVWITKGQQPKVIFRIQPEYPDIAKIAHIEGEVKLEAIINERGKVESVRIIDSTNKLFNDSAIKAAMMWRFEPGKINDRPVKAYFILTIRFRLTNAKIK